MAGGRSAVSPMAGVSRRLIIPAILSLLLLASVSVLILHRPSPAADAATSSLRSIPLRLQAADHSAVASAYAAYARRLKLEHGRQLRTFSSLAASLSSISSRASPDKVADEDSLRPLEREAKDQSKLLRQLVTESKESFDTQLKVQKLRDTVFAVHEQLLRARRARSVSSSIAAASTPKSLHCLAMRLLQDLISHQLPHPAPNPHPDLADPALLHYVLFSDNIIAASVVVNSALRNAAQPRRHIFHVVTLPMYLNAMRSWFHHRPPPGGSPIDVRSISDFPFLNSSDLGHLRFYLPDMFPELRKIVLLEDDVVVQKDLEGIWRVDMEGKVNAAVETCFGGFMRYSRYLNFSHPVVRERFNPRACAWAFGVNVFDLDAWRREGSSDQYSYYRDLNKDGSLWKEGTILPAGLMTFYATTKRLDRLWHVMGLGYNPSVSPDEIRNAAVIHFNGDMKPWLDVTLNQYKHLWTKYVDTDMEFLQLCNFGV